VTPLTLRRRGGRLAMMTLLAPPTAHVCIEGPGLGVRRRVP
jgi:hypothetical protein